MGLSPCRLSTVAACDAIYRATRTEGASLPQRPRILGSDTGEIPESRWQ